jgi:hypothetical protein
MKLILIISLLIFSELGLMAQNDTLAINQVITQLFDGMRTSDSNLVKDVHFIQKQLYKLCLLIKQVKPSCMKSK